MCYLYDIHYDFISIICFFVAHFVEVTLLILLNWLKSIPLFGFVYILLNVFCDVYKLLDESYVSTAKFFLTLKKGIENKCRTEYFNLFICDTVIQYCRDVFSILLIIQSLTSCTSFNFKSFLLHGNSCH